MNKNNYPKHEFTKYIDMKSINSNKYINENNNKNNNDKMMLEPRIQEYIKKKKYYKTQNIKPIVDLEKEFQISKIDKKIIREYIRGKEIKNIYKKKYNNNESLKKKIFPSSKNGLRNDPRVPKNSKKITNEIMYNNNYNNIENILDDRIFSESYSKTAFKKNKKKYNIDESRFEPRNDPRIYQGVEKYNKKKSHYNLESKICDLIPDNKQEIDETELIRGMPIHTMKSYGYRNPEEHYYNYIDEEIQNPDNIVLDFPRGGESTRINNKKITNKKYISNFDLYNEEIYN